MTSNVGSIDRALRVIVGLALIAFALGFIPSLGSSPWGFVGIIPLLTGLVGSCPAYSLLGFNTCGRRA